MEVSIMVAVKEFSWEEVSAPDFEHTARTAWRAAVVEIAAKAKATLPECNGRVDRAVQIVLNHDVELLEDGQARVASQSSGQVVYYLVNGECPCKDYPKAASGWCKHRIAAGLYKRATALVQRQLAQPNGASNDQVAAAPEEPVPTAPEADASTFPTPGIPPQHVVMIQGKPFVRYAGLLQMAQERGLTSLTATWTFNDTELSLAHAVATFQDGRIFTECGDATPANTTRKVAVHFRRVALTRAKARALRDALGVDLVSVEELADSE
jgi:hypothetical protein